MKHINKNYISPIDKKLSEFDRNHQPSPAQIHEASKYKTITSQRDHVHLNLEAKQQSAIDWLD